MKKTVLAYAIQHKKGDFPFVGLVELPLGAEPFAVVPMPGGALGLIATVNPTATIIDHPVIMMESGVVIEEPVGLRVGPYIGMGRLGQSNVMVFRGDPWPKTLLESRANIEGQA